MLFFYCFFEDDEIEASGKYAKGYNLFLDFFPNLEDKEVGAIKSIILLKVTEEDKLF